MVDATDGNRPSTEKDTEKDSSTVKSLFQNNQYVFTIEFTEETSISFLRRVQSLQSARNSTRDMEQPKLSSPFEFLLVS